MYVDACLFLYFLFAAGHLKLNLHQNVGASLITLKNKTLLVCVLYLIYLRSKSQSQIPSSEEFPFLKRKSFWVSNASICVSMVTIRK
jgi:hypothetical protein